MKRLNLAVSAIALSMLLPVMTSCKSDASPFDMFASSTKEKGKATVQLRLLVEETRAGEMATSEECEIKKVTILVFNEKEELELNKTVSVFAGNNTVSLEGSNGLKTIYAIAAKSNVNPGVGMSITDYENSIFTSTLPNLMTEDGFVMVGKSVEQQVINSVSEEDIPSSNIFDIKLVRLVAKAQVKCENIDGSSFGINFGTASFKACQLSERMRVKHNGSDVFASYVDGNHNGTYDYYSLRENGSYINSVTAFSAEECEYMSENIVSKPVSGNTTFLSIRFATTPVKYYTFDSSDLSVKSLDETPSASTTYYAVAIQDQTTGVVDYALDNTNKHIITFKNKVDAENYMNSLNNGDASTITVSQYDTPLKVASRSEQVTSMPNFEVITFQDGYVYYRVNIAHQDTSGDADKTTIKVVRNKFYKVNINSVKSLGFSSESLLRPSNPNAVLDAQGHSWISANVTVADWDEVKQNVDL
ncbi:MAG: fimbria major subunit [Muribaculaceae bacterium]|nr:fimbria major subunit [Muribaculaceae bacterium]